MIRGHGEEVEVRERSGKFLVLVAILLLLVFGALTFLAHYYLSSAIAEAREVEETKLDRFSTEIKVEDYQNLEPSIEQLKLYSP